MILISHRGNISGKLPDRENSPDYIVEAIKQGYDVEIDLWRIDNNLYLGHNEPQYMIDKEFLYKHKKSLWIHAKNIDALIFVNSYTLYRYFWHQNDDVTLTSDNFLWTYPGKTLTFMSIAIKPETVNYTEEELKQCHAICSDYIDKYKKYRR